MDDDIIDLSDDGEDDCILIEETTIVSETKDEKICNNSFHLIDAVKRKNRSEAISKEKKETSDWLAKEMEELDELMKKNQHDVFSTHGDDFGFIDLNLPSTSTSAPKKPEKRKLTEEEKEAQRVNKTEN
uniref:Crossover junction endonuclease MUS81 n=1 Tax=Caenorhabditis tropicalis TaxID=1561998 RepID=A0A1I7UJ28_9PELO